MPLALPVDLSIWKKSRKTLPFKAARTRAGKSSAEVLRLLQCSAVRERLQDRIDFVEVDPSCFPARIEVVRVRRGGNEAPVEIGKGTTSFAKVLQRSEKPSEQTKPMWRGAVAVVDLGPLREVNPRR